MNKSKMLFGDGIDSLSIQKVSDALGVTRPTVYRWKADPSKMPLWAVVTLAKIRRLTDKEKAQILC